MKTNLFRKPFLTFILGAFFGGILISSYAFISKSTPPQRTDQYQPVALTEAVSLTNTYSTNAQPLNEVFRGFAVNKAQLEAMNKINKENPDFTGFRIYMGETAGNDAKAVVVGISPDGNDAVAKTMYKVGVDDSGPCPTVCDSGSALINVTPDR